MLPAEAPTGLGCPTLCFATKAPSYRVQPSGRQPIDQFCVLVKHSKSSPDSGR